MNPHPARVPAPAPASTPVPAAADEDRAPAGRLPLYGLSTLAAPRSTENQVSTPHPDPHPDSDVDYPDDLPDTPRTTGRRAAPTAADATDAARLVSFGLQPKLLPVRDLEYGELVKRYRDDSAFARLADAIAAGLGLIVLEVSMRAGLALAAAEESVFAVRLGEYSRRAAAEPGDRFLHGLAHLAVATMAFPRPEDLADDGYIGRITVHGIDAFVRQACRRLEEQSAEAGDVTDPLSESPGLEAGWRAYARRTATGATKDARRLSGSTIGIIGKAVSFLADSGFLQRATDDAGGTYRTTARYQLQVRDMAGGAAMSELLDLGIVPVSDGSATLLPPDDSGELVADAGLPFHAM